MDRRSNGASHGPDRSDASSTVYRLKLELRREQHAGRDDSPYAHALRRVLGAFSDHEPDDALALIEDELLDLEARPEVGTDKVEALRRVLVLSKPSRHGSRELFTYYLRKMEADGRGDEPFARALRKALKSPGTASLEELYHWKNREESSD